MPTIFHIRVDYSSSNLLPLWQQDNGRGVERIVVYDPRSLAQVWVLDETTDTYLAVPTRVPRPDLTLAQSEASRRALHASKAQDRTEDRLFENVAKIKAIEAAARTATTRRKAERSRQAAKGVRAAGLVSTASSIETSGSAPEPAGAVPAWAGRQVSAFTDIERL